MAGPTLDNNKPKINRATLYIGDTTAKPADYTVATMDTFLAGLTKLADVETFTMDTAEAYSVKNTQGRKYRLLDTITNSSTLLNASHANYNALLTSFNASNMDLLVVYGEEKAGFEVGDEFRLLRDLPFTVSMPETPNEAKRLMIDAELDVFTDGTDQVNIIETITA